MSPPSEPGSKPSLRPAWPLRALLPLLVATLFGSLSAAANHPETRPELPSETRPETRPALRPLAQPAQTAQTAPASTSHSARSLLRPPPTPADNPPNPDAACASCHQAIYTSYEQTTMAHGSGPAANQPPPPAEFLHQPSQIRYAIFARDGQSWFSYDRGVPAAQHDSTLPDAPATPASPGPPPDLRPDPRPLHGERPLSYFIGSGQHGRTYLYQIDGTWFELPINYYTRRQLWDMAPAFDSAKTMPADLPVDPGCLHCHATAVSQALPGTRSHYAGPPFAQGGIGCSACHGDPSAHLAAAGHGPIVNPGRLDPARRDSACLACHLEGDAVVFRPGRSAGDFQPGEDLSASATYFVRASQSGGGGRAASQYEALLRSACKRAAGDRLTCTTCHDPHASPAPADRVAFYRARCLSCHTGAAIATQHHPEQPDCASCHMPTRATSDISHEQAVDHDIERTPAAPGATPARDGETLLPVGNWQSSDRELGLAYAQMVSRGDRQAGSRALALLSRAEAAGASDPVLHAQLGFLEQATGDRDRARAEYLSALQANPDEPSALANLAVLDATTNHVPQALSLLEHLIALDPARTSAGLNLAFIECRLGQTGKSLGTLAILTRYNPDDPALRTFRTTGNYAGQHCPLPSAPQTSGAPKPVSPSQSAPIMRTSVRFLSP